MNIVFESQELFGHFKGLDKLLTFCRFFLNLYFLIILCTDFNNVFICNFYSLNIMQDNFSLNFFLNQVNDQQVFVGQNQGFHDVLLNVLRH